MFVHRVLGVFEEGFLPSRGRAVLVLPALALGGDGAAGFLVGQFFLCSAVLHLSWSAHAVIL